MDNCLGKTSDRLAHRSRAFLESVARASAAKAQGMKYGLAALTECPSSLTSPTAKDGLSVRGAASCGPEALARIGCDMTADPNTLRRSQPCEKCGAEMLWTQNEWAHGDK